jgi:hypothetical protein
VHRPAALRIQCPVPPGGANIRYMDLGLSPANLTRVLQILSHPRTAEAFARVYWPTRVSDPPGRLSRRGHALLASLVRQGVVRRNGSGGPAHDTFVVATSAEAAPLTPAPASLPDPYAFGAAPVLGVEFDAAQCNVRLHGVAIPLRGDADALARSASRSDFCEAVLVPLVQSGGTWRVAQGWDERTYRMQWLIENDCPVRELARDTDVAIPWPGITVTPGQALRVLWLRERLRQAFEGFRALRAAMVPGAGLQPDVAWTVPARQ